MKKTMIIVISNKVTYKTKIILHTVKRTKEEKNKEINYINKCSCKRRT